MLCNWFAFVCLYSSKSPFLLDWENEVLSRRQKAGRGNLADDSATNAAIEAASIKKLTFKADSLQRVIQCNTPDRLCLFFLFIFYLCRDL